MKKATILYQKWYFQRDFQSYSLYYEISVKAISSLSGYSLKGHFLEYEKWTVMQNFTLDIG